MLVTPKKWQVSYSNNVEWRDFNSAEEAQAFMETEEGSTLMVFDENSNHIDLFEEQWFIVDNEPLDDGYDYDRYY